MKKSVCLVLSMVLLAATVYGAVNLPKTGQNTMYAVGDDGEIQAGAAWPSPRFTDRGNGTVIDNLTGLVWASTANVIMEQDPDFDTDMTSGDGEVFYQTARAYLDKLNSEAFSGYSDWRLPNRKELLSLIDFSRADPALTLYHPFGSVQNSSYWSSTTYSNIPTRVWTVDLSDGLVWYGSRTGGLGYVWPVRTEP